MNIDDVFSKPQQSIEAVCLKSFNIFMQIFILQNIRWRYTPWFECFIENGEIYASAKQNAASDIQYNEQERSFETSLAYNISVTWYKCTMHLTMHLNLSQGRNKT